MMYKWKDICLIRLLYFYYASELSSLNNHVLWMLWPRASKNAVSQLLAYNIVFYKHYYHCANKRAFRPDGHPGLSARKHKHPRRLAPAPPHSPDSPLDGPKVGRTREKFEVFVQVRQGTNV